MTKYKGFIFDLNGTMIDDMAYHEQAWYEVLVNELKAPLTREQVKKELYGKQREMFQRIFGNQYSDQQIEEISQRKEKRYRDEFLPDLKLINGLDSFLRKARQKSIALAIGTAAPPENVDFVLDNLAIRPFFPVIIGANDVINSKPDPEVFLKAAQQLNLQPADCVVFEDAPKGIEAARRAGMKAVGITSFHTAEELKNDHVIAIIDDYNDTSLQLLFE